MTKDLLPVTCGRLALALAPLLQACAGISGRFCGLAVHNEQGNNWGDAHLAAAAGAVGAGNVWHYNWLMSTGVSAAGVEFVPMIKFPGQNLDGLPAANTGSVGHTVKGWNEPDDPGQAGSIEALRTNPEGYAQAWTSDMLAASAKGYREFVGPAMAHDTCWLDYFLKACEGTARCKDLVTYLALHRYRNDCSTYAASPDYQGWREDLGYILSMYRLKEKYNQRGFRIKGLVWDEFGCLTSNFQDAAPEQDQRRYLMEWYKNTVVQVLKGDSGVIQKIQATNFIGPNGPDAHSGQPYNAGMCQWQNGGTAAAADAVKAIQDISSMAWFSIHPGRNYLFSGSSLTELGQLYFEACAAVPGQTGSDCHTATESDECYGHVTWARGTGIKEHPEWYPGLDASSSFEDMQEHLWKQGLGNCPQPCPLLEGTESAAGPLPRCSFLWPAVAVAARFWRLW